MTIFIGLRAWQAKEYVVGKIAKAYAVARSSDPDINLRSFVNEIVDQFKVEPDALSPRSCYSCLERIASENPILLSDDDGMNYSFHGRCLIKESVKYLRNPPTAEPVLLRKAR